MSEKYELIDSEAEKAKTPIVKMCAWLEVSKSGFYEWRDRPDSATAQRRERITALVVKMHEDYEQRYGYRKVQRELARQGEHVSEWLVRDIMAVEGLVTCQPKPWRSTTDNDGSDGPADLLGRDFTATEPGVRFVGDITYIKTWEGWLYLATVIDLFNREVVGWSMATHLATPLVTSALDMAIMKGLVKPGAVFHSDRGSQYTSLEFALFLGCHDMKGSMGRVGVCWDNAPAESFFATLKKELVHRTNYPTRKAAKEDIAKYVEVFYNRRRIHSSIGYTTPLEARQAWTNQESAS